jgi:hypothetical protein
MAIAAENSSAVDRCMVPVFTAIYSIWINSACKPQEKLGELISIIKAEYRDILINKQDCSELYGDTHNKRKEARFMLKPAR